MEQDRKGITIITGFLGAGKTTLLNNIIKTETNYKFAIIENEFGELGIDAEIIKGVENSNIFELSNGCICCTMNMELQETLEQLLVSGLKFNHLLIETTGIAEPDSIIQAIVANNSLKEIFYIDSIICLVDAPNFKANIEKPESLKQITLADIIIINKTENVDNDALMEIKLTLEKMNPFSKITETTYANYSEKQIINTQLFNEKNFELTFNNQSVKPEKHLKLNLPITNLSIELEGNFDNGKFRYWMEYFLLLNQSTIYRAKGILSFENNSRKQIFQAVKATFTLDDGKFWQKDEIRKSKIIFIGNNLNKPEILDGLISLLTN